MTVDERSTPFFSSIKRWIEQNKKRTMVMDQNELESKEN